jgi:hypothetical protein
MIITVEGVRGREREIKRTYEAKVLCYNKSTTCPILSIVEDWGIFLFSLLYYFVTLNHQINLTCFFVLWSS